MDISCIISSGDLELYVLGMLSPEDNTKVSQLAMIFPEIKKEIEDIEHSLLQIGDDATMTPSQSVKLNLFSRLGEMKREEELSTPAASLQTNETDTGVSSSEQYNLEMNETKVIPLHQPVRRNFMVAASVIALVISILIIVYLVSVNSRFGRQNSNLQAQVTQLQNNLSAQQQLVSSYSKSLELYESPSYIKINLAPVAGKPDNLSVQLLWNKSTHAVYATDLSSLPQPPTGKQYQLWAIVDGKPVNAGMLNMQKMPQEMIKFDKADAFAITLEKEGGNPTPEGEMYVMGKTS